jgi:hypothetical protein
MTHIKVNGTIKFGCLAGLELKEKCEPHWEVHGGPPKMDPGDPLIQVKR